MEEAVKNKLHKATGAHVMRALDRLPPQRPATREEIVRAAQQPPIEIVRAKWRPIGFEWDVTFPGAMTLPASNKEEVYQFIAVWLVQNHIDRYSLVWDEEGV